MDITDEQWAVIEPLIIQPVPRADGKGRSRQDDLALLNGMIWILRTEAACADLPDRYPPYHIVHRLLQEWIDNLLLEQGQLGHRLAQ